MNVSGVGSTNGPSGPNASEWAARRKNFEALRNAVSSGDTAAAKTAYDAIQKDMQNAPAEMKSSFDAIGKALDSGDPQSVKDAFASWQSSMQKMRPHHGHRGGKPEAPQADPTANQDPGNSNSTFTVTA